jgi:tripartite-type tricarboxylate transporter receptor subunit TctC
MRAANVIDVHPSVPVNSVPELIAYAKANPGRVTMDSAVGCAVTLTRRRDLDQTEWVKPDIAGQPVEDSSTASKAEVQSTIRTPSFRY